MTYSIMSATHFELDTNQLSLEVLPEEMNVIQEQTIPDNILDGVTLLESQIAVLEFNSSLDHKDTQSYLDDRELFHYQEHNRANNSLTILPKDSPSALDIQRFVEDQKQISQLRAELQRMINPDLDLIPQNRVNEYYKYGTDGRIKYKNGKPEVDLISIEHEDKSYLVDVFDSMEYNDPENEIVGKVWFVSGTTRNGERNPMGELNIDGYQQGERIIFGKYSNELYNVSSIGDNSLEFLDRYSLIQSGNKAKGMSAD